MENRLYLDLLKRCLTRTLFPDGCFEYAGTTRKIVPYDHELRLVGRDWPVEAVTMVGIRRLENLQSLLTSAVVDNGIQGDVVECGVWRGGASIFMRAVLVALGQPNRRSWLYDSFQGLPKPADPTDCDLTMYSDYLGVPLHEVRNNFDTFGLLSEQVHFVPGWFKDTLPTAQVEKIVLLRLDGDMYESTMDALTNLYPKIAIGGYVVIDDFGAIPVCKTAVEDFRRDRNIVAPMVSIDWTGAYWRVS